MYGNSKNDQFLVEKLFHKYCPAAIGTEFNTRFVFDAGLSNTTFWNISNLGLCCNSVALNISFKDECIFQNTKIHIKRKLKGFEPRCKWKCVFHSKSWTKDYWQIHEIK